MVSSRLLPDLPNDPNKTNWVEQTGNLPDYFVRVAKHIYYGGGGKYTLSHAIAGAIEVTKKRAADGNKEAIKAVAQWEKMKAQANATPNKGDKSVKLSSEKEQVMDRRRLISIIRLFQRNRDSLSEVTRSRLRKYILSNADNLSGNVSLANQVVTTEHRTFDETKYRRVGGKFASKGQPTSSNSAKTPRDIITNLNIGSTFDIPGIAGSIKRTDEGYEITGPNGFKTTASSVQDAMSVAARLIAEHLSAKNSKEKK